MLRVGRSLGFEAALNSGGTLRKGRTQTEGGLLGTPIGGFIGYANWGVYWVRSVFLTRTGLPLAGLPLTRFSNKKRCALFLVSVCAWVYAVHGTSGLGLREYVCKLPLAREAMTDNRLVRDSLSGLSCREGPPHMSHSPREILPKRSDFSRKVKRVAGK